MFKGPEIFFFFFFSKGVVAVIVNRDNADFISVHKLNCTTSVNKCKFNFLVTLVYRTPKYSTMQRQVFTRQKATSTTLQSSLHATQIVISEKYSLKGMRKSPRCSIYKYLFN